MREKSISIQPRRVRKNYFTHFASFFALLAISCGIAFQFRESSCSVLCMNTCTICNSPSNISVKLPQYAPDKKLAFVESVCEELIKDRFGPWYVFESSATAHDAVLSAAAGWDLEFATPRGRRSASALGSGALGRSTSRARRSGSVPPAVAGGSLGRTTPRASRGGSVPSAVAGGVLGRMVGDSVYGIYVVPTSRRGLECSRTPVTIVPGTDPRFLAQPRGSPRLALTV